MTASPSLFPDSVPAATPSAPPRAAHLHVAPAPTEAEIATPSTPFETSDHFFFGIPRLKTPHPQSATTEDVGLYAFDDSLALVTKAFASAEPLFLVGPTGAGKTTYARYLSRETGWAYYETPHDAQLEIEDILGKPTQLEDGRWVFSDGPVVRAYEHGGIYVADEAPAVKPAVLQAYHPILTRSPLLVRTDAGVRNVKAHPTFRFIATGNPWNTYAGNYEPGFALIDRCIVHEFDYLPSEKEVEVLLADGPNVGIGVLKDLVAFASAIRAGVKANPDTNRYTVSTRSLRKLVRLMEKLGATLEEATQNALLTPLRMMFPDEYESVASVLHAHVALGA